MDDCEAAARFLAECAESPPHTPPPEVVAALAGLLPPREGDSPAQQARREVLFRWLWNAAQTS